MNVLKLLNEKNFSLEDVVKRYKLVDVKHPTLPLHVLNYSVRSPKFDIITKECRSLVLSYRIENDLKIYSVVGKSFDRFFNLGELSKKKYKELSVDFQSCFATRKEDGSLMLLFFYEGSWIINTRYNYSKGKFSQGMYRKKESNEKSKFDEEMTYERLFMEIATNNGEKNFEKEITSHLNPEISYIFEMCSPKYNKIVKKYESSRLFLLSCIKVKKTEEQQFEEMSIEYSQTIAEKIGVLFPVCIRVYSLEDCKRYIYKEMKNDPTLEGVVLRDKDNKRIKIKNPGYLFLHNIRYDRLIEPHPKDLIHFVLHCSEKLFLDVIDNLCSHNNILKSQIIEKFKEVKEKVFSGFLDFKNNWNKIKSSLLSKEKEITRKKKELLKNMKFRKILSDLLQKNTSKITKITKDEESEGEEEEQLHFDDDNEEEDEEEYLWNHFKEYSNYLVNHLFPSTKKKKNNKSQTTRTLKLTELEGCSVNLEQYHYISKKYLPSSSNQNNSKRRKYSKLTKKEQKCFGELKKKWNDNIDFSNNNNPTQKYWWEEEYIKLLLSQIENDGLSKILPRESTSSSKKKKGVYEVFCFCGKRMTLFVIPVKERLFKCIRDSCKHCKKPKFYRSKFNAVYRCESCGIQHGCYQADVNRYTSTGVLQRSFPAKPFGIPCSTLCLVFRHFAHEVFDTLYIEKRMSRARAYEKLGELLGLDPKFVHVGLFSISRCLKTIEVVLKLKRENGW